MTGIELHNFRRFDELPFLEFGKITFLVGSNSSGKSSISKAIAFIINNIMKLNSQLPFCFGPEFDFSNEVCQDLNIVNFKKTLSTYNEDGVISIGLLIWDIYLKFDIVENTSDSQTGIVSRIQITNPKVNFVIYPIQKRCLIEFNDSMNAYPREVLPIIERNVDERSYKWNPRHENMDLIKYGDLDNPACGYDFLHYEEVMEEMSGDISDLPSYAEFCEISDLDLPNDLDISTEMNGDFLPNIIRFISDKRIRGMWSRDRQINQSDIDRVNYFESLQLLERELGVAIRVYQLTYMPINLLPPDPLYTNSEFADLLHELHYDLPKVDSERYDKIDGFICKWLKEFNVGTEYRINKISDNIFQLEIRDAETNQWIDTSQMGRGALQIVTMLLHIALLVVRYFFSVDEYSYKLNNLRWWDDENPGPRADERPSSLMIIMEEPELCLHPCAQSKLAEMMLDASDKFDIRFIVETHSEYLIRRSQVLVAKENYDEFSIRHENPFKVYYFPSEGIPYDMEYRPNGRFERPFGKGFFDEASKWNDQLIWGIMQ